MRTHSLEVIILDLDTSDHGSSPSLAVFIVCFFVVVVVSVSLFVVVFPEGVNSVKSSKYLILLTVPRRYERFGSLRYLLFFVNFGTVFTIYMSRWLSDQLLRKSCSLFPGVSRHIAKVIQRRAGEAHDQAHESWFTKRHLLVTLYNLPMHPFYD